MISPWTPSIFHLLWVQIILLNDIIDTQLENLVIPAVFFLLVQDGLPSINNLLDQVNHLN